MRAKRSCLITIVAMDNFLRSSRMDAAEVHP
jgi:hypothetical protein